MASKSKAKGYRLEAKIVKDFEAAGHKCIRAWGSSGKAIGEADSVDNLATVHGQELRIQAKSRKSIADYLKPPKECNVAIVKEDRCDPLVVMRLPEFLEFVEAIAVDKDE